MGRILTNYPPKKPLTPKQQRIRDGGFMLNKATKSLWLPILLNRVLNFFIGLYVRLIYVYRTLKAIRRPHLGDIVYYQGKRCELLQGVAAPYWDLWCEKEKIRINAVNEKIFKLQPLWRRFFFSFRFTYRFFMGYWYSIDVNNRGRFIFNGKLWRKK